MRSNGSQRRRAVEEVVIPLAREELKVGRKRVHDSKVVVDIGVEKHQQMVPFDLLSEHIEVRRVRINRECERMPAVRHEGNTTIIPLVEEVVEVRKRLIVREEIHLVKHRRQRTKPVKAIVRAETATVRRVEARANKTQRKRARSSRRSK